MEKQIVMLLGSPRKNGNSEQMADAFIEGAQKAGNHVVKIYTEDLETGCCGCGGCYHDEQHPCCRHNDFNQVASTLLQADGIVFAAPLYWYDIPGKMKCFIDNLYCFYHTGKNIARKKTAMLCCGQAKNYMMFDGVQRTFELISKVADWSIADQIYAQGVGNLGDITDQRDVLKRCEALGERFFNKVSG